MVSLSLKIILSDEKLKAEYRHDKSWLNEGERRRVMPVRLPLRDFRPRLTMVNLSEPKLPKVKE